MNKKAFSMIEMIFAIIIVGIIASIAVPKLLGSKDEATVSTIKQDVQTVISSVQTYYMVNGKIEKISDSVVLNSTVWDIEDLSITYKENDTSCVNIKVLNKQLSITIDASAGDLCQKIYDEGVRSNTIDLK